MDKKQPSNRSTPGKPVQLALLTLSTPNLSQQHYRLADAILKRAVSKPIRAGLGEGRLHFLIEFMEARTIAGVSVTAAAEEASVYGEPDRKFPIPAKLIEKLYRERRRLAP